jgi:hypothetical protein
MMEVDLASDTFWVFKRKDEGRYPLICMLNDTFRLILPKSLLESSDDRGKLNVPQYFSNQPSDE